MDTRSTSKIVSSRRQPTRGTPRRLDQAIKRGATVTAPATSPSHHVTQSDPNWLHGAAAPTPNDTTPIVALIVVQTRAAITNLETSRARPKKRSNRRVFSNHPAAI